MPIVSLKTRTDTTFSANTGIQKEKKTNSQGTMIYDDMLFCVSLGLVSYSQDRGTVSVTVTDCH